MNHYIEVLIKQEIGKFVEEELRGRYRDYVSDIFLTSILLNRMNDSHHHGGISRG